MQTVCHLNKETVGITFKFKTVLFVLVMGMEYNGTVQDQTCIVGYVTSVLRWRALKKLLGKRSDPIQMGRSSHLPACRQKSENYFPISLLACL